MFLVSQGGFCPLTTGTPCSRSPARAVGCWGAANGELLVSEEPAAPQPGGCSSPWNASLCQAIPAFWAVEGSVVAEHLSAPSGDEQAVFVHLPEWFLIGKQLTTLQQAAKSN